MLLANLFVVAESPRAEIRRALADLLGLSEEAVDVGDWNQEDRNWAAPVLCTYCPLPPGDLALSLDITVTAPAAGDLTEADLALGIAARVGSSVLYPAESYPPSATWAAVPDGRTVRCSMESVETGYGADAALYPFRVYDVTAPVPDLPPAPPTPSPPSPEPPPSPPTPP
ncbi:hypothetical protein [Streptomyces sp. NPDC002276]